MQPIPTASDAVLDVRDLRTHFFTREGVVRAVDGLSFSLREGETLGIVGESGCGKSLAAKSILRIVEPPGKIVSGRILLKRQHHGRADIIDLVRLEVDGAQMRAIRGGEIALIFQEPMSSFSPVHTIGAQMMEATRFHRGLSRQEARDHAVEMLKKVGVSRPASRIEEYAHQMSGGIRQRAMIALALSCSPRILVADEPTTALDVTTQAQILDLLRRLQAEHRMSVLLITHNLGVVAEMCDRVAVMYLGKVVEQGPVAQILGAPKHPYTQALLESIPSMSLSPRTSLSVIAGAVPPAYARPSGCAFHPRCGRFMPGVCDAAEPPVVDTADDHSTACFLYHGSAVNVAAP